MSVSFKKGIVPGLVAVAIGLALWSPGFAGVPTGCVGLCMDDIAAEGFDVGVCYAGGFSVIGVRPTGGGGNTTSCLWLAVGKFSNEVASENATKVKAEASSVDGSCGCPLVKVKASSDQFSPFGGTGPGKMSIEGCGEKVEGRGTLYTCNLLP